MKAEVFPTDYTAQIEIHLTPESFVEKAVLEHFDKHVTTFRLEDDALIAVLSIGKDSE